jgi:integrase
LFADACSRLQEATIATYEGVWRRAVERRLGDRPLDEITPRGHDDPDARLFVRDDGDWFMVDDWNNWRSRHFYVAFDAIEITRRRPYDLRHALVALMIREGDLSIVELADQLGHAATETLRLMRTCSRSTGATRERGPPS